MDNSSFQQKFLQMSDEIIQIIATIDAKQDVISFLEDAKQDFEDYSKQLATGEMSQKDVEYLLRSKKELLQMILLKHKGLATAKVEELQNKIIAAIIKAL